MKEKIMIKKLVASVMMLSICSADTIYFNNGAELDGTILERNTQTVTINIDGTNTTYAMRDVKNIVVLEISTPPPPPPPSQGVQEESLYITLPAGTIIHTVMSTTLSTKQHKAGHQFKMVLDNDIVYKGVVVATRGSDVYGVVTESKQAGRIAGKSSMMIELAALSIDNQRVLIHTNKINAMNESGQGKNTAGKVARGAAIGGLVDGKSGARTGVKVGAGAAVLTRGQATSIPSGTILDFRLSSDVEIKR